MTTWNEIEWEELDPVTEIALDTMQGNVDHVRGLTDQRVVCSFTGYTSEGDPKSSSTHSPILKIYVDGVLKETISNFGVERTVIITLAAGTGLRTLRLHYDTTDCESMPERDSTLRFYQTADMNYLVIHLLVNGSESTSDPVSELRYFSAYGARVSP